MKKVNEKEIKSNERESTLDVLRFFLAFVVINEHVNYIFHPTTSYNYTKYEGGSLFIQPPFNIFLNGQSAVLLFFILSGYLFGTFHGRKVILFRSLIARIARFVIPVTASILIITFMSLYGVSIDAVRLHTGTLEYHSLLPDTSFLYHLKHTLIDIPFGDDYYYMPQLWTIAPELTTSLLLIVVNYFCYSRRITGILVLLLALVFYLLPYETISKGCNVFIGYMIGLYKIEIVNWNKYYGIILLVISLPLLGYLSKGGEQNYFYTTLGVSADINNEFLINSVGAFMFFLGLLSTNIQLKKKTAITYLGKCSFSIYLIHYPILIIVGFFTRDLIMTSFTDMFFISLCVYTFSVIFSILFFKLIELPTIKFTRNLKKL